MTDRYDYLFRRAAAQHKLPDWKMLKAIAVVESSLDESARRFRKSEERFYRRYIEDRPHWKKHRYYHQPQIIAASYGLMQLLYTTAEWMGFKREGDWWLLFDPVQNVNLGARFYLHQWKRYNQNRVKAVAAYNAGTFRYSTGMDGVKRIANEWYVKKVEQAVEMLEAPG